MNQRSSAEETATIFVVSGSPAQIPGLGAGDGPSTALATASTTLLTEALKAAAPISIVSAHDPRWYTAHSGSFRAWGAEHINVGGGHFLGELVARWLLRESAAATGLEVPELRSTDTLDATGVQILVLDGSAGLTPRAPLALLPGADEAHAWCMQLLTGERPGNVEKQWLERRGVIEAQLWLELQAHSRLKDWTCTLCFEDTSLGVGRYVARWDKSA